MTSSSSPFDPWGGWHATPSTQPPGRDKVDDVGPVEVLLSRLTTSQRRALPRQLNAMQQQVMPVVLGTNENLIISAPTGAGKTAILDAAIVAAVHNHARTTVKMNAIYLAPSRALCQLQTAGFASRFSDMGVRVHCITGDDDGKDVEIKKQEGRYGTLIVTTPEKYESMHRRSGPHLRTTLLLVDEIHHVGEPERGATLEVVITRLARRDPPPRIVAVSATIPNADDIARWIHGRAMIFHDRPCPLHVRVLGFPRNPPQKSEFLFEKDLDRAVPDVLRDHSQGRPTLVFVSSRKGAEELAIRLADSMHVLPHGTKKYGCRNTTNVKDVNLARILRLGVGWHTAGLESTDRDMVEREFKSGQLGLIVCTSTLAVGVDLPAFCVVIKSTRAYRGPSQGFQTIERATLVQMCGRAGRPGADTEGVAVIMTEQGNEDAFEDLASGLVKIQSTLGLNPTLAREALNVEICNGTVLTEAQARAWWSSTLAAHMNTANDGGDMLANHLAALGELGCVVITPGGSLKPTSTGKLASSHHLRLDTVRLFSEHAASTSNEVGYPGILEKLQVVCSSEEFISLEPRRDQKKFLNMVAWTLGRFTHAKSRRVMTWQDKTLQLIQCTLGGISIADHQLRQEAIFAMERAPRLARALTKLLVDAGNPRAVEAAALSRYLELKTWDELLQLDGVGVKTKEKMQTMQNINTLQDVVARGNRNGVAAKTMAHVDKLMSKHRTPLFSTLSDGSLSIKVVMDGGRLSSSSTTTSTKMEEKEIWVAAVVEHPTPKLVGFADGKVGLIVPHDALPSGRRGGGRMAVWVIHRQFIGIDVCTLVDFPHVVKSSLSSSSSSRNFHVQAVNGDPWASTTLKGMAGGGETSLQSNKHKNGNIAASSSSFHIVQQKQDNTRRNDLNVVGGMNPSASAPPVHMMKHYIYDPTSSSPPSAEQDGGLPVTSTKQQGGGSSKFFGAPVVGTSASHHVKACTTAPPPVQRQLFPFQHHDREQSKMSSSSSSTLFNTMKVPFTETGSNLVHHDNALSTNISTHKPPAAFEDLFFL